MDWIKRGPNYMLSANPAGFAINKALVRGRVCYMAIKLGTPWKPRPGDPPEPKGWDGSTIVHVERDVAPDNPPKGTPEYDALSAAYQRCKEACERCV